MSIILSRYDGEPTAVFYLTRLRQETGRRRYHTRMCLLTSSEVLWASVTGDRLASYKQFRNSIGNASTKPLKGENGSTECTDEESPSC
jgi:hypothetical protein